MSRLQSPDIATFRRSLTPAVGAVRAARIAAALVPALIALVAFAVFSPALQNDFVDWDDAVLIAKNEAFRGLGWPEISWMFSTNLMGHYVPVTWLTLGLDYTLWGMDPAGYHFTNVLFHAANAALFYFLALRLLRAATTFAPPALRLAAAVSALFFALHPLRAESVAWVTERRDVLSGFFFFLTLLLYLQARDHRGAAAARRHAAACLCYLLAILSKSMVMTLPALLILLDLYPFRRLDLRPRSWLRQDVWREKIPYLALGLLAAMLGYWAQAANRFVTTLAQVPWSARPAMVTHSLWFYVSKTLLPFSLSPLYEMPSTIDVFAWRFAGPALMVVAVTVVLVALAPRWPAMLTAAAAYAITLGPVIGIVHSGHQLTHDRYSYLACLGWALLLGGGVGAARAASARGEIRRVFGHAITFALVGWFSALAFLTWHQVGTWRDTGTLWYHAVDSSPDCSLCELNLGTAFLNENHLALAAGHLERALSERPDQWKNYQNLGLAFARQGEIERAAEHFGRVVRERPDDVNAVMNLGVSLMKLGRRAEATVLLQRAGTLAPEDSLVLSNLGTALMEAGKTDEAIDILRRAIDLHPAASQPRFVLVQALVARGDLERARREHAFLRVVDPRAANFIGPALVGAW